MTAAQYQESSASRLSMAVLRGAASYAVPFTVRAVIWQIASLFFPPFLFPCLVGVFWRLIDILMGWSQFVGVLATVLRIRAGLDGAFLIGALLAVLMAR